MDWLRRELEGALEARLYYLALVLAVSLPDVCAALAHPSGETNKDRYKQWAKEWFLPEYPSLTADYLYKVRCGVVHQARLSHSRQQYERVVFTLPVPNNILLHNNVVDHPEYGSVINFDLTTFCLDMVVAVERWYAASHEVPVVKGNYGRLVQYHDKGTPPIVQGIPTIA